MLAKENYIKIVDLVPIIPVNITIKRDFREKKALGRRDGSNPKNF